MAQHTSAWENERIEMLEEQWQPLVPGVDRWRFPGNEPIRRLIAGRRVAKVGAFWSWKNAAHVAHETTSQEWCARIFEVHPSVTAFTGQPEKLRIEVEDQENPITYTPDFRVMFGHAEVFVEVRRFDDVAPPPPVDAGDDTGMKRYLKGARIRRRLRIVREAYHRCGIAWRLITDRDLTAMASKRTTDEIIANCGRPVTDDDVDRLIGFLLAQPNKTASMAECCQQLQASDFPRGDLLARIPERLISIDLHAEIDDETPVSLLETAR
jgi:hypothetical protein